MPEKGSRASGTGTVTRRRWLKSAAAASAVAMAGCSGGGDGGDGTTDATSTGAGGGTDTDGTPSDTTTSGPTVVEDTLKMHLRESNNTIPEANLNWWGANSNGDLQRQVYTHSGTYSQTHNFDWVPMSVESWEEDAENNELRVQIRDDVYWTQGGETIDPFTAGDVSTWLQLQRYMTPAADRTDNPAVTGWRVEGDDDRELVMELNPDGYNVAAVEADLRSQFFTTYRNGFFGTKLEELKAASTADEKSAIREEIAGEEITLSDDPPLCSPWMLSEPNPQTIRMEINEEHWLAQSSAPTPRNLEINVVGGGSSSGYQALQSGDVHITDSMIPDSVPTNGIPDHVQQVTYATNAGWTLKMNYGGDIDPYMGIDTSLPREEQVAGAQQAKVRQGIAHAINMNDVLANHLGARAEELIDPFERAVGAPVHRVEGNFPDLYESLPSYTSADEELAAQRLEEAGLTEESGTWTKPDGDSLSLSLQATSTNVAMLRTIRQDLQDFGVDTELETLGGQAWARYDEGSYAAVMGWIQDQLPLGLELRTQMVQGVAWPNGALPEKYEIPPIGEMDAEPTETIHPRELSADFETENLEAHAEAAKKMAWAYAYHLPDLPLMPWMGGYTVNTRDMNWADPSPEGTVVSPGEEHDPLYGSGYYTMGRLGSRGQSE